MAISGVMTDKRTKQYYFFFLVGPLSASPPQEGSMSNKTFRVDCCNIGKMTKHMIGSLTEGERQD